MRIDVHMKGKNGKISKSVERSASVNGACRDEYER